mmetsp:Transcript_41659/g.75617  ORF Transcript_41659/g.75617 Transcript_41659/m.75617 type:complete len:318 (-) Transcript_41659:15-968(-)
MAEEEGLITFAARHRAATWCGLGVVLCTRGWQYRYTSIFLPILRYATLEQATECFQSMLQQSYYVFANDQMDLQSQMIWSLEWKATFQVLMTSINTTVLLDVLMSGFIATIGIGLADVKRPHHEVVTVSQLEPYWRSLRASVRAHMRRHSRYLLQAPVARVLKPFVFQSIFAPDVAEAVGRFFPDFVSDCVEVRLLWKVDMISSCIVNSLLGAELLRLASVEALPWLPAKVPWLQRLADTVCLGVGLYGVVQQVQQASLPAQCLQHWSTKVREQCDRCLCNPGEVGVLWPQFVREQLCRLPVQVIQQRFTLVILADG